MERQVKKKQEEFLSAGALTVHLHWDTILDLDIFVIYDTKEAKKDMIYFAQSGSQEKSPFIELLFDFEFSEIPVDNQQIMAISQMEVEKIWIFAWDFDAVQDGSTINFQEQKVFLEIRHPEQILLTSPEDLAEGNLALLGVLQKSSSTQGFSFCNISETRKIALPEQMEDLLQILPEFVT